MLGYISNSAHRFHVFISNRIQQIRDLTSPGQWRYIESKANSADFTSHDLHAQDLIGKKEWWSGSKFLWTNFDTQHGVINNTATLSPQGPEIRKISALATGATEPADIEEHLCYFSSWHQAKRAIAVCFSLKRHLQLSCARALQLLCKKARQKGKNGKFVEISIALAVDLIGW